MIWAKSVPGNKVDVTTHRKQANPDAWTQVDLEHRLSALGFVRGSRNLYDYERAKRFIDSLNLDAHIRDRLIRWAIDYIGV